MFVRRCSFVLFLLVGCSTPPKSEAVSSQPASTVAASTVQAAPPASESAATKPPQEPTPTAVASASAAPPAEPLPDVEVKNIGMHVGGGKNDASEKAPIKRSVEPHLDDFKKCFAKVDDPKKGGDFGVDLHIDRAGGKAKVDHPRTSLKGDGFKDCVLAAFDAVDFEKPKGGTTTVSYSLRFTPPKGH